MRRFYHSGRLDTLRQARQADADMSMRAAGGAASERLVLSGRWSVDGVVWRPGKLFQDGIDAHRGIAAPPHIDAIVVAGGC